MFGVPFVPLKTATRGDANTYFSDEIGARGDSTSVCEEPSFRWDTAKITTALTVTSTPHEARHTQPNCFPSKRVKMRILMTDVVKATAAALDRRPSDAASSLKKDIPACASGKLSQLVGGELTT